MRAPVGETPPMVAGRALVGLPGAERELRRLVAMYPNVAASGHGRTVFVSGDAGSGRGELLRASASELRRARPRARVLGGEFVDDRYVAWENDAGGALKLIAQLQQGGAATEWVASVLSVAGVAPAALIAQLLSLSAAPLELARRMLAGADRPVLVELAPRALRLLCEEGPVVCIVDRADQADAAGLWADLVLGLASRVATNLPLLLVLGMDGPKRLGAHRENESDALNVARHLTEAEQATWMALAPATREDLRNLIGPADPKVPDALLEITDGRPLWIRELWDDWRRRGVVDDDGPFGWRFVAGPSSGLNEVDDLLARRFKRRVGTHDLGLLAHAREILLCAAMEGRRFTPAAVADALDIDRNELIDLLDDTLVQDAEHPEGLVTFDGWHSVSDEHGDRDVSVYSFARELDWLALLHHHARGELQQRALAHRLADALAALYGGAAHRVAGVLCRLYGIAGDAAAELHYRRMADLGVNRQIILSRARAVLDGDPPTDPAQLRRATLLLTAAAAELNSSGGPFHEGLRFAQAACRFAPYASLRARPLHLMGLHRMQLGDHSQARLDLAQAHEIFTAHADRFGQAWVRHALASICLAQGDYADAREQFTSLIDTFGDLRDLAGEASTRSQLAHIDREQGTYDAARHGFLQVLDLRRRLRDRNGESDALRALAGIKLDQGLSEDAHAEFTQVLALDRELGRRSQEATVRHDLATQRMDGGALEEARAEFERVLAIRSELGDRAGMATTGHQLAVLDARQERYELARRRLVHVVEEWRQLGDGQGEANSRRVLATIDAQQGRHAQARAEFGRLMGLCRELEDRRGQADVHYQLAHIAAAEGAYEEARSGLATALALFRELGDPHGEADTLRALDTVTPLDAQAQAATKARIHEIFRNAGGR